MGWPRGSWVAPPPGGQGHGCTQEAEWPMDRTHTKSRLCHQTHVVCDYFSGDVDYVPVHPGS